MAVKKFIFNGINSANMGLYVSGDKTFNSAEKEYEKVSIPGRSGDLLLFSNRYKNVDLTYHSVVFDDDSIYDESTNETKYLEITDNIRSWLLSANGYCRLEDDYHPNEFRMAAFAGPLEFDTYLLKAGELDITFDCKPQRWLTSGETEIVAYDGTTITNPNNPTSFPSKPLIKVQGSGYFTIGDSEIHILPESSSSEIQEDLIIDCETQDCYYDRGSGAIINKNGSVVISKWPVLNYGITNITVNQTVSQEQSNITRIKIIPRWWKL